MHQQANNEADPIFDGWPDQGYYAKKPQVSARQRSINIDTALTDEEIKRVMREYGYTQVQIESYLRGRRKVK